MILGNVTHTHTHTFPREQLEQVYSLYGKIFGEMTTIKMAQLELQQILCCIKTRIKTVRINVFGTLAIKQKLAVILRVFEEQRAEFWYKMPALWHFHLS